MTEASMALRCQVQRLEVALDEVCALPCTGCDGLVFYPGWWCDDYERCAHPALLADCDNEPNGDDEPDDYT